MTIRSATPEDRPAIIELLKKSLGESAIPKSERLWLWKHEENPFGKSFVLLSEQDGELIGLRAFLQWQWKNESKEWKTIRAVDTATHPAHQGKGIFKKLTLQQVEMCKKDGIDFVFNTPNDQSRPGYLKMGWQQQGRMPLKIGVRKPLSFAAKILMKIKQEEKQPGKADWSKVEHLFKRKRPLKVNGIHTPMSYEYVNWRYAINPLFTYSYLSDLENYVLIFRIKHHGFYNEMRMTDFILFDEGEGISRHIRKQVRQVVKSTGGNLISFSGNQFSYFKKYFRWIGLIPVLKKGPVVTLRIVSNEKDFPFLLDEKNWLYSLGDMELF